MTRVLFATAEAYPLIKTGGLADVSAALPRALADLGVDIQLIMPAYPRALALASDKSLAAELPSERGTGLTRLIKARMPDSGLPIWLVDAPWLFDRPGTPYRDEFGRDWPDNAKRFAWFCRVAAKLACGALVKDWHADVVHANDWHTGLLPLLIGTQEGRRPATVFTIHNLAYQGLFPSAILSSVGLSPVHFTPDGFEFYGDVSFLKSGIQFSDRITTVSPSYAQEILTPEYGCGLDGLLRRQESRLTGILNGVDYQTWGPSYDPHLPDTFAIDDLTGKRACKAELQRQLQLAPDLAIPLIVWVSRLTDQKMADVVLQALHRILDRDVQLAILGEGEPALEEQFRDASAQYPGRLAVRTRYDEKSAHRFLGGGDLLLHPSRFEPCGLTPLYAMRYGAVPIVRHVGGLVDSVIDATEWTVGSGSATGFSFRECSASAMLDCLDRALAFFAQPVRWREIQKRGMSRRFGWEGAAKRYLTLYRKLGPCALASDAIRPACGEDVINLPVPVAA